MFLRKKLLKELLKKNKILTKIRKGQKLTDDERDYGVGASILRELGLGKIKLITNNPIKRKGLEAYGLEIVENIPLEIEPNEFNKFYLETKQKKMGHALELVNVKPNIKDK